MCRKHNRNKGENIDFWFHIRLCYILLQQTQHSLLHVYCNHNSYSSLVPGVYTDLSSQYDITHKVVKQKNTIEC